jgi:hypothetical protein
MNSNIGWKNVLVRASVGASLVGLGLAISGCGKSENVEASASSAPKLGANVAPADRPYFDAAKPFADALAARDYRKAFESLSSHARARVSPNQFVAPEDDKTAERNEAAAVKNPTPDQFAQMLGTTEKHYGSPSRLLDMTVFSTDAAALSGTGTSAETRLESMFAIGMMPASVPADIRKASLRAKVMVELSPEQIAEAAKAQQTTPDKLKSDPDFRPYLNLKMVLVQDGRALKIGYFEILPPGLLD